MTKTDRRIHRTRNRLQQALIDLIREHRYDAITIQDIVDRADVGRTTFYLHYDSKDDLFLSCHEAIVSDFQLGSHAHLSREELLSPDVPSGMTAAFRHLEAERALLYPVFQGKYSLLIQRRIRDRSAQTIEASLRAAFDEDNSMIPFDVLANYLAGAQIALVHWWLEQPRQQTPETLAQSFHRLQRAAIMDALQLRDDA
jgi:AcrR family transcriptional regulator